MRLRAQLRSRHVSRGHDGMEKDASMRDPTVSESKGAPKRGKEHASACPYQPSPKRRCCTRCGIPGHTRRTCAGKSQSQSSPSPCMSSAAASSSSLPSCFDDHMMDHYRAPPFQRGPYATQEASQSTSHTHAAHGMSAATPSSGNIFFGAHTRISKFFASPSYAATSRELPNFPPPIPGGSAFPSDVTPDQRGLDPYGFTPTQRSAPCSSKTFWRGGGRR